MKSIAFRGSILCSALAGAGALISFLGVSSSESGPTPDEPVMIEPLLIASRTEFHEGQSPVVELRLVNRGSAGASAVVPGSASLLIDPAATLQLTVVGSLEALARPGPGGGGRRDLAVPLFPGAFWGCSLDLAEVFGPLEPDTYTLRLRYEVTAQDAGRAPAPAGMPIWQGRSDSPQVIIKVLAADQPRMIQRYADQWKKAADGASRLRALLWLKANVLGPGMSAAMVRQLLGDPTSQGTDGGRWEYRVGRTGIVIEFEGDKVARVSSFES